MAPFNIIHDGETGEEVLEVALRGYALLNSPLLNKGSAFSDEERRTLGLQGLLPPHISTLEEQAVRAYANYQREQTDLERYMFLIDLQDRSETLFYRLLQEHIVEMMPIIYTPVVGAASQLYSHIYRRSRGLYIGYQQREHIEDILHNVPHPDVRMVVVTDGERILGLGDLGVGGMGIPVGKLALYTVCGGVHPARTLPIVLDVGTDNQQLLDDPLYLGWRHRRVRGEEYDAFIDSFVQAVQRVFPQAILHWEDFSKNNAGRLLARYADELCTFNDDIQGTGAVTLAGVLAALDATGGRLSEQRIVILGAGSAAIGISDQLVIAMQDAGCSEAEALAAIWLVDSRGLVHSGRADLEPAKRRYAQPLERIAGWPLADREQIGLDDVVCHTHPTILIGTSAQPGAFNEPIVRMMARYVERPIIFPLSNPTSKSEAVPADLIAWTDGRAIVATGSPFPEVHFGGRTQRIGQCNNAFIFPGLGLGVLASGARRITDSMFVAAARALSACAPIRRDPAASLYPALEEVRGVARRVALAVGIEAQRLGLAPETTVHELERRITATMWTPHYLRMRPNA